MKNNLSKTKPKSKSKPKTDPGKKRSPKEKKPNFLAAKHRDYLSLLASFKNKKNQRNKLIDLAEKEQVDSLTEVVRNILRGNIALSKRQLSQLRRHRHALRSLAQKRYSINKKKSILKQKGGLIGAILPMALKALTSIFPALIS